MGRPRKNPLPENHKPTFQEHKDIGNALISATPKDKPVNKTHLQKLFSEAYYMYQDYPEEKATVLKLAEFARWAAYRSYKYENDDICNIYYAILLWEAQELRNLDAYFVYLERKREFNEMFYAPKREQLMKIGLIQALQDMIDDKCDILTISLPPGTGKGSRLDADVLTPDGFVKMRDIKVGSKVIAGNGNVAVVQGVFPLGKKPTYRFTMDDGSYTDVSDDHLWTVQTRDDRKNGKYRTVSTMDIIKNVRVENGKRLNYSLDYVPRIEFPEKDLPIDPYLLGVILGDGGIANKQLVITKGDADLINKCASIIEKDGYEFVHRGKYNYRVVRKQRDKKGNNIYFDALRKLDLWGKHSYEKFIPEIYKYGSYEQRLWLLRGLLDTDGSAESGYAEYSTSSEQLANDVKDLVHSLGGYCSVNVRDSFYNDKDGNRVDCRLSYRLLIQFDAKHENPFWLPRKAEKYKPKREVIKRFIKSVELIGEYECQCIYISDPCHLYITDDYIITHNTTLSKFFISAVIGWFPNDFNLFFSHSGDIARMYYDGVYDIVSNSDEYCWHEIFPDLKVTSTNAKMQQFNIGKYKPFPSLQCTSRGSNNAGVVRASKFLMVDDLIAGIEEAMNKNQLDKLWNIYAVDARQRKIDGAKEIHIATRWSVHDVIGRIQRQYENDPRCRFISIPDIDHETGKSNFNYRVNGFSEEFFHDQEKIMDDVSYRCLYKNEPIEREGLLYHVEDLRRYATLPVGEPDAILSVCDTKSKGVDYFVMPVMYKYGSDYYMVDCLCNKDCSYDVQYEKIINLMVIHNVQMLEIEANMGGDRVAHEVSERLKKVDHRCNITTKYTESNKETRIIVNAEWVKSHVLFRQAEDYGRKSEYGEFMSQLLSYSVEGKNPHDDVCDAMANFVLFVTREINVGKVVAVKNPFWR